MSSVKWLELQIAPATWSRDYTAAKVIDLGSTPKSQLGNRCEWLEPGNHDVHASPLISSMQAESPEARLSGSFQVFREFLRSNPPGQKIKRYVVLWF